MWNGRRPVPDFIQQRKISQKDRFRNILASKMPIEGHIGLVNVALNGLSTFWLTVL